MVQVIRIFSPATDSLCRNDPSIVGLDLQMNVTALFPQTPKLLQKTQIKTSNNLEIILNSPTFA